MESDRMQVPAIQSQSPTLVPPAPYSIPPLGFDVRPPKGWDKERIATAAFVMGALVGALLIGAVRTALLERVTGVTAVNVMKAAAAAPPPAPVCPPVPPPVVQPAPEVVAAAPAAPAASDTDAKPAKATPRRRVNHAPKHNTFTLSNSTPSDEAFMRAIKANSH